MPCLNSRTRLKPLKRAWRSFTATFRSKLRRLDVPIRVKAASDLLLEFLSQRIYVPFRRRFLTKPSNHSQRYNHPHQNQYQSYPRTSFHAIYVDQVYGDRERERSRRFNVREGTSRGKEVMIRDEREQKKKKKKEEEGLRSIEDAWSVVVASSPHLRVDERAEEFIHKFRQEMRVEKERSFLEFQERLKRSA